MEKVSYVYILASERYGTLYTGVTANLIQRVWQHREKLIEGFTKRYEVDKLVWYEVHSDICNAIVRAQQLKHWQRAWKLDFISEHNPEWRDLYDDIRT